MKKIEKSKKPKIQKPYEYWARIEEFPKYQISNLGRVRHIEHGKSKIITRPINARPNEYGYMRVSLYEGINRKDHIIKGRYIHRLVATAFIPNPLKLPQVNHINRDKTDYSIYNLEWRTKSGNYRHSVKSSLNTDRGVTLDRKHNTWRARYSPVQGKREHIGMFSTKSEALQARRTAVESLSYIL